MGEMMRQPLAMVAAIGRNHALGYDGRLPWSLAGDLARFKSLTMGKPMIMGRRTFESIGRALPGRESIVVSRESTLRLPADVHLVASPAAALDLAETRATAMGADGISLIGGATLFDQMMGSAACLHMTFVDLAPAADTFFPAIDSAIWRETSRFAPFRQAGDAADYVFVDYVRR